MEELNNQATIIDVNGQTKMTYDLIVDVNGPTIEMQQVHHFAVASQDLVFAKLFSLLADVARKTSGK